MSKFSAWRMISKYFHMIVALAQELSKQGTELKIFGNTFWLITNPNNYSDTQIQTVLEALVNVLSNQDYEMHNKYHFPLRIR